MNRLPKRFIVGFLESRICNWEESSLLKNQRRLSESNYSKIYNQRIPYTHVQFDSVSQTRSNLKTLSCKKPTVERTNS